MFYPVDTTLHLQYYPWRSQEEIKTSDLTVRQFKKLVDDDEANEFYIKDQSGEWVRINSICFVTTNKLVGVSIDLDPQPQPQAEG